MGLNQRIVALAVLAGVAAGSLGGPSVRTIAVQTSQGVAVYRASGLGGLRCAATLVGMDKSGREVVERGHTLNSRVIVRCDDPSAVAIPAGATASTIEGLGGYLLIDGGSVREALALARAMRSMEGVRWARLDIEPPRALRSVPTDPFVELEWHFRNLEDPGIDANFVPAWEAGYSGAGVVVGIVEPDNVEHTHPDLAGNFSAEASVVDRRLRQHPTSVAGIIAMVGNNDEGGAGGAYGSEFSTITIGSASKTAEAFLHRNDINDIKNNSWGPADNGRLGRINPIERDALREGVASGRAGLGEVYVWAAGNGGANQNVVDRVDYDPFASSRFTIAVGAYDDDGDSAAFNEIGSSMLVCAPSDGHFTHPENRGIFTTDLEGSAGVDPGDYTDGFGGTSASSPIAAAAVALMLEANPSLTWRDVQHILVDSARMVDLTSDGWEVNGSGRLVHYNYGYGSVDAGAAVAMSETWRGVGEEAMAGSGVVVLEASIPDGDPGGLVQIVEIEDRLAVESVELVLNIRGDGASGFAGDLDIRLVSPSGFESVFAESRNDFTDGYQGWIYTSTRHWGELSEGEWTILIADEVAGNPHIWEDFELRVFGTELAFCPADLSGASVPGDPDYDVPDGDVDADDFFRYLDLFAAGDARADLTGSNDPNDPGYGVPDGVIDVRDFFFYLELFSRGCE